jgi:3-hydroxyacyl-CoA dehydrogenase
MSNVHFEQRGTIAVLTVDHPPVNAVSQAVRAGIIAGVQTAEANDEITAIVLACAGRTFMAGADITEFGKGDLRPSFADVLTCLDNATKPIVAAIHGTAFGGGLEIALTCHYRIALATAQIGLPEVKLGIIPGAGGTQRLPRIFGVERALEAITSGDPIPVGKAGAAIDAIVETELLEAAIAFAKDVAGKPLRRVSDIVIDKTGLPDGYFDAQRARFAKEKRNLFAPQRCVDAVEAAVTLPFAEGIARERELIGACFANSQSKALQHVFFAERQVTRIPGLAKDVALRPINKVGIIGAGTMGGGIAMNFANAGIPVTVLEAAPEALERGLGIVRRNYEATAKKGRLTSEQVEQRMALLQPTLEYKALGDCDIIIEAVFETMEVKRTVFGKLDAVAKPGAILASNTSYLSIDAIAEATSRPQDVIGTHFFSPANVMRLCEIVRGAKTAPDVLATTLDLAKRIRKIGVVSGNCHGFIGNRMLSGYAREASLLALEGAAPAQVDKVLYDFGMPMGLFQMGDLAGLDIGYKSRRDADPATLETRIGVWPDKLVESGRLGQKTGAGYYDYEAGDRTPRPSAVALQMLEDSARELGITRRTVSDQEILERCLFALVNEGIKILEEGIAYRASDIDIVYLNGYGFPAYRGGPMFWAAFAAMLRKPVNAGGSPQPCLKRWWPKVGDSRRWAKDSRLMA